MKCKGLGFFPARVVRLLTWWLISRKKETEAVGIIKTGAQKSQNVSSTTNLLAKANRGQPRLKGRRNGLISCSMHIWGTRNCGVPSLGTGYHTHLISPVAGMGFTQAKAKLGGPGNHSVAWLGRVTSHFLEDLELKGE